MHSVQATVQLLFEPHVVRMMVEGRFLRSRIFLTPLVGVVRDGDVVLALARSPSHRSLWLLYPDQPPEAHHLVQDHLPHLRYLLDHLEVEVEGGGARRLVARVVPDV